jgi:hypothetical protein
MKKSTPLFRYALWGSTLAGGFTGIQVAGTIIRQYEVIANGILGIIVIYFLCRFFSR